MIRGVREAVRSEQGDCAGGKRPKIDIGQWSDARQPDLECILAVR
jgi:hypothetical protein